jgi:hypothetical protein
MYAHASNERNYVAKELAALECPDPPGGGLQEELILQVRQTSADGTIAVAQLFRDLRRQRSVTARELFEAIEQLYMQGNIEVLIRDRTGRS